MRKGPLCLPPPPPLLLASQSQRIALTLPLLPRRCIESSPLRPHLRPEGCAGRPARLLLLQQARPHAPVVVAVVDGRDGALLDARRAVRVAVYRVDQGGLPGVQHEGVRAVHCGVAKQPGGEIHTPTHTDCPLRGGVICTIGSGTGGKGRYGGCAVVQGTDSRGNSSGPHFNRTANGLVQQLSAQALSALLLPLLLAEGGTSRVKAAAGRAATPTAAAATR